MSGDNSEPLLGDVESWGNQPTIEEVEDDVTEYCSVDELLVKHHTRVLRYVQEKGVALLGEFEEEDNLVFPAFAEAQLLCFGADDRKLDYETEWRKRLKEAGGKRAKLGGWSNKVAVEAFVVTIRGAAAPDSRGLLQPLLKRYQAKRCSYAVFALPAVQAVIHFKWTTYARRVLMVELFLFLLWLISFNVFTIAFQDEDLGSSLHDLLRTARGRVTVAAEIMALVGMAPFLLLEVGTISAYGFGWLDLWNSLDMLTYCTQIGVTICHLGRFWTKSDLLTTLLVIQSILLVFRLQWYTQALQTVRMAYLPIIKEVWVSLRPAFFLMLLVMWGYATAFCCALRNDQEAQEEYSSIITSFLSMFEHQYGDVELTPMLKTKSPIIATSLAVSYIFVQGTIIINVLLGIVLASIERASQNEGMKMLLNQAKIIDEIESTLPSWVEKRWPHWFPPFVHILRIIPEKLDRVEQDALWSLMGRDEPQALQSVTSNPLTNGHPRHTGSADLQEQGSGGEGDGGQEEGGQGEGGGEGREQAGPVAPSLQKQMAAMQRQMERQERLLQRMCAQLALPQGAGSARGREGLDSS